MSDNKDIYDLITREVDRVKTAETVSSHRKRGRTLILQGLYDLVDKRSRDLWSMILSPSHDIELGIVPSVRGCRIAVQIVRGDCPVAFPCEVVDEQLVVRKSHAEYVRQQNQGLLLVVFDRRSANIARDTTEYLCLTLGGTQVLLS